MIERDVRDVFDELQRMYTAFNRMRLTIDRPDETLSTDLATLDEARAKIEKRIGDHLRAVEESVT